MTRETYIIEKGDFINDEPVELTVYSSTEAETSHYDLEIEWDDQEDLIEGFEAIGTAYANDSDVGRIHKFFDSDYWFLEGTVSRESDESPFIAVAQAAYAIGVGWD